MIVRTCVQPPGNFGDSAINSYMVERITGKKPTLMSISQKMNQENYLLSGSVLGSANDHSIIWGPGFLDKTDLLRANPKGIYAVRGKLTRQKLLAQGIECPEIYGDPTLLMPRFYLPLKLNKTDRVGLIPHYSEMGIGIAKEFPTWKYKIINICSGVESVIKEVCECEKILSSSLHGLMVAHAYGVPYEWVKLSNMLKGGDFKFLDFFSSLPELDLDKLWEACPFK